MARITASYQVEELFGEERGGRPCVRLLAPIEYRVGSEAGAEAVTVPAGFVTDFASVPWLLWNLFPPVGRYARPAIIHDFLYSSGGHGEWAPSGDSTPARYITRAKPYSRKEADSIFLEAMEGSVCRAGDASSCTGPFGWAADPGGFGRASAASG